MGRGRSEKQKQKLLYMAQLLYGRTDEDHPVTTQEVIDYLEANGIRSERKTVYTDMEELEDFGLDIIRVKERPGGYYLASRKFELAELKLLVDAVQASKFITTKKSRELIAKLETLCGREQAKQLHRQVVVTNRSKAVNENIYYNVDMIYNAIAENVKIRFQYFEWTVNKEMKLRRDGSYYEVSPWLLSWDDENYYLIAYTEGRLKHYRVDKMQNVHQLPDTTREGAGEYANFDVNTYMQQMFGMFNGPLKRVTLQCENRFAGAMIDRFGTAPILTPCADGEHFTMTAEIQVSPQFFGWVAGFGTGVVVSGPPEVRAEMKKTLDQLQELYR